jgi:hypothetical protein
VNRRLRLPVFVVMRLHPSTTPVLLLAILAGCDGTDSSAGPSDEAALPPTSAPSAKAAGELTATGEPLDAGRYTRAGFEPAITIELDGSWQAVQLASGFFDVQQRVGSPDVIAVQFARPIGIYGADGTSDPAASAEEAVEIWEPMRTWRSWRAATRASAASTVRR